ncbi:hypothetical protein GFO_1428 [Christiangramia forsetii KT0803]|uniref:Uncharacterized protein n=1 Tax=Christiangramia forsetii (strain DSM 17595 / CGMCC 1.15422 / KT0803) TaxID=411154 RepID=A0M1A7_CHRFK|nr:hypothetical protein GFO_1428 [Christiangramia forsetii KT0803]
MEYLNILLSAENVMFRKKAFPDARHIFTAFIFQNLYLIFFAVLKIEHDILFVAALFQNCIFWIL